MSIGALPVILPVNFALDGRAVVFRTGRAAVVTGETSRLDRLVARPWVANSRWVRLPATNVSGRRLAKPSTSNVAD